MEMSQEKSKVVVFSKTNRGILKNYKKWTVGKIDVDEAIYTYI